MDYKEAIKTIQIAKAEVEWNYPLDYQIAFDAAIDCIKSQIPRKPLNRVTGNWQVPEGECAECGTAVFWRDWYCPRCGQRINWGDGR